MEYRNEYKRQTRLQMARQIEDRTKEDEDCMILFEKWLAYDELKEGMKIQ